MDQALNPYGSIAPTGRRIAYFDGLRGLACLQVVTNHYVQSFGPGWAGPLAFVANGECAVSLFFLMSGFVLSGSFAQRPHQPAANLAWRLARLECPALVSVVIAACLFTAGHDAAQHAAARAGSLTLAHQAAGRPLAGLAADLSGYSLLAGYRQTSIFFGAWLPDQTASANPVLWTISIELYGSIWIILLTFLRHRSPAAHGAALLLSLGVFGINEMSLFTAGHLCWLGARQSRAAAAPGLGSILVVLGVALCCGHSFAPITILAALLPGGLIHDIYAPSAWQTELGALLIFCGVLRATYMQYWLARPPLRLLGRLSFSIYLLHWPIMFAAGSAVFVMAWPLGQAAAAGLAFAAGLAVTLAAAALFERSVDAPVMRFARAGLHGALGQPPRQPTRPAAAASGAA